MNILKFFKLHLKMFKEYLDILPGLFNDVPLAVSFALVLIRFSTLLTSVMLPHTKATRE